MSEPTVAALNEILYDLTDNWEQFALHLPGFVPSDIETITIEKEKHLAKQKIALYNKWLHVYPNASWDDVVKALENPAVRENAIAERVRNKYCHPSNKVTQGPLPLAAPLSMVPSCSLPHVSSQYTPLYTGNVVPDSQPPVAMFPRIYNLPSDVMPGGLAGSLLPVPMPFSNSHPSVPMPSGPGSQPPVAGMFPSSHPASIPMSGPPGSEPSVTVLFPSAGHLSIPMSEPFSHPPVAMFPSRPSVPVSAGPGSLPTVTISSNSQCSTDEADKVKLSEEVVKELDTLYKSFVDLSCNVREEIKQKVEKKDVKLSSVIARLQEEQAFPIPCLNSVRTTDEVFETIRPYYNFLNCYLIISIAVNFLTDITAKKANDHEVKIEQLMKKQKIEDLQNTLEQYTCQPSSNTKPVKIAIPNYWKQQNVWLVKMLIKTLFPIELPWYNIVRGSVIMTFIALEHMTSSLIESSRKKTEFMRLIGVISLKIGDELVWCREMEDAVLSFEDSLIRATLTNNIEAVQFILQYTQVDINTRNTNRTLFNVHNNIYNSESETIDTLKSFQDTFNRMNYELIATTSNNGTNQGPVDLPCGNFLNGRALASMKLSEEQLTELAKYIEMVDSYKRLFPVCFLSASQEYFQTPFPGSIEVFLTLHSVWSTCSVWYVEQLGQLIFTPTLFYQLQWLRVDRREESVRVCLLADGKLMNSLKECLSNNESRISMLGVISVQIDDTVMITNDYSDGYTFLEAIELAKANGDDEIFDSLHQILESPVDYYDIGTHYDDNNNFIAYSLDPDSTPLMIACCNDNSQLVQLLIDHNANPNTQNGRGVTALMYSTGNSKIFQMLLDHGADINRKTFQNITVMHSACIAGNEKVVKALIAKDASQVYFKDILGQEPLMLARSYGHTTIVKLILLHTHIVHSVTEDIVNELDLLENSFLDLVREVVSEVRLQEERTNNLKGEVEQKVKNVNNIISIIAFRIQIERAFSIPPLDSVQTTDELFEAIYPHYNFLNCYLIIKIALFLCGTIAEKATTYDERVKAFMKTTKIEHLRNILKRYCPQRFRGCSNTTIVEIEVENGWGDHPLWLVTILINTLFPVKHPDELPWYDIVPG